MTEDRLSRKSRDVSRLLRAKQAAIGVIGLGYTGLPLALASAGAGFRTYGYDTDTELCARLNQGISHIEDVSEEELRAALATRRFAALPRIESSPPPDVIFLCVPTPFGQTPDLSCVRRAARSVAGVLAPGMVVIAQSTSYPGTTTEVVQPLLEESGLRAGQDFVLAFSPERIDPANSNWNIRNTPRIIGSVNPRDTQVAAAALAAVLGDDRLVRPVASPAVAEFAKLLENAYRLVNIGLVNELAMLAHEMGIDIGQVIEAAATKPYGFQAFYPGVGPGGACVPEDPLYLAWKARTLEFHTALIDLAAERNQGMARYVASRILSALARRGRPPGGSQILCVGAGYKPDVADTRHARALRVMELLAAEGAAVRYSDPLIGSVEVGGQEIKSVDLEEVDPGDVDLLAVLVASKGLNLDRFLAAGVAVFDAAYTVAARRDKGEVERL